MMMDTVRNWFLLIVAYILPLDPSSIRGRLDAGVCGSGPEVRVAFQKDPSVNKCRYLEEVLTLHFGLKILVVITRNELLE